MVRDHGNQDIAVVLFQSGYIVRSIKMATVASRSST